MAGQALVVPDHSRQHARLAFLHESAPAAIHHCVGVIVQGVLDGLNEAPIVRQQLAVRPLGSRENGDVRTAERWLGVTSKPGVCRKLCEVLRRQAQRHVDTPFFECPTLLGRVGDVLQHDLSKARSALPVARHSPEHRPCVAHLGDLEGPGARRVERQPAVTPVVPHGHSWHVDHGADWARQRQQKSGRRSAQSNLNSAVTGRPGLPHGQVAGGRFANFEHPLQRGRDGLRSHRPP